MDWNIQRGIAVHDKEPNKDLRIVDLKILFMIIKEFKEFETKYQVKENTYGRWIIK